MIIDIVDVVAIVDAPVYVDAAEFNVTVFLNVFVV